MTKTTLAELNEKYKDCPVKQNEFTLDGRKYIVRSHFIGEKDINAVIRDIAFQRAMNEMLTAA